MAARELCRATTSAFDGGSIDAHPGICPGGGGGACLSDAGFERGTDDPAHRHRRQPDDRTQATQVDAAMPADCQEMAKQGNSSANTCWAHCYAGPQVDADDYAPAPLVAPQTALLVRLADPGLPNLVPAQWLLPFIAAPPPQLRFSRLLI